MDDQPFAPSPLATKRQSQRKEALALGNSKRSTMARFKRLNKSGQLDGLLVLLGRHDEWEDAVNMLKVGEYLMSFPRFGEGTRDDVLAEMKLHGMTRMSNLTFHQRQELVRLIREIRGDLL